jgi:hypothetical protein
MTCHLANAADLLTARELFAAYVNSLRDCILPEVNVTDHAVWYQIGAVVVLVAAGSVAAALIGVA